MGHPHKYVVDGGRKDKGTGKGNNIVGAKPKVYGNSNYKPEENQGQGGGPVSHEWRRRQMLFDYGIDIGDEFKKKGGGR